MMKMFDDMCSRFHTIPACDRQTDRHTDTDTDVYYTLAAKKPDSLIMGLENTIEQ